MDADATHCGASLVPSLKVKTVALVSYFARPIDITNEGGSRFLCAGVEAGRIMCLHLSSVPALHEVFVTPIQEEVRRTCEDQIEGWFQVIGHGQSWKFRKQSQCRKIRCDDR